MKVRSSLEKRGKVGDVSGQAQSHSVPERMCLKDYG